MFILREKVCGKGVYEGRYEEGGGGGGWVSCGWSSLIAEDGLGMLRSIMVFG